MARSNKSEDFGHEGFSRMKDFGFSGSVDVPMKGLSGGQKMPKEGGHMDPPAPMRRDAAPKDDSFTQGGTNPLSHAKIEGFMNNSAPKGGAPAGGGYAEGGQVNIHPHGQDLHHVDSEMDGGVTHHHAHGGYTTFHTDGNITHHTADGQEAMPNAPTPYADGGSVNAHPHGHSVTHTERMADREVHRHSHGGFSVHYDDGRAPTHHGKDGVPAYHTGGTAGEYAKGGKMKNDMPPERDPRMEAHQNALDMAVARGHYARTTPPTKPPMIANEYEGDEGKKLRKDDLRNEYNAFGEFGRPGTGVLMPPDKEDGTSRYARGGHVKRHPHHKKMPTPAEPMPMGRAAAPKPAPMAGGMPINRPPRNPQRSPSPRNEMPGGVMPYGVQPSAEPDISTGSVGSAPGVPMGAGMKRGGRTVK